MPVGVLPVAPSTEVVGGVAVSGSPLLNWLALSNKPHICFNKGLVKTPTQSYPFRTTARREQYWALIEYFPSEWGTQSLFSSRALIFFSQHPLKEGSLERFNTLGQALGVMVIIAVCAYTHGKAESTCFFRCYSAEKDNLPAVPCPSF